MLFGRSVLAQLLPFRVQFLMSLTSEKPGGSHHFVQWDQFVPGLSKALCARRRDCCPPPVPGRFQSSPVFYFSLCPSFSRNSKDNVQQYQVPDWEIVPDFDLVAAVALFREREVRWITLPGTAVRASVPGHECIFEKKPPHAASDSSFYGYVTLSVSSRAKFTDTSMFGID